MLSSINCLGHSVFLQQYRWKKDCHRQVNTINIGFRENETKRNSFWKGNPLLKLVEFMFGFWFLLVSLIELFCAIGLLFLVFSCNLLYFLEIVMKTSALHPCYCVLIPLRLYECSITVFMPKTIVGQRRRFGVAEKYLLFLAFSEVN